MLIFPKQRINLKIISLGYIIPKVQNFNKINYADYFPNYEMFIYYKYKINVLNNHRNHKNSKRKESS